MIIFAVETYGNTIEDHRLYRSAYFLGRGDTGIADADSHEAIYYNPAGLALGKGLFKEAVFLSPTAVLSEDTKNLFRKFTVENNNSPQTLREHIGENQHIGLNNFSGVVFRRWALGGMVDSKNNILLYKSPDNRGVEIVEASSITNVAATVSIAESFFNDFMLLGSTIKYVQQSYSRISINVLDADNISDQLSNSANEGSYSGTGVDLGAMFRWSGRTPINLGLTIENLGGLTLGSEQGDAPRTLPQTVNIGGSAEVGTKFSHMKFYLDFRDILSEVESNFYLKTHLGGELSFANIFGLTFGLNQGYPGLGAFFNIYLLRMDVGTYTQEVGSFAGSRADKRIFIRISTSI